MHTIFIATGLTAVKQSASCFFFNTPCILYSLRMEQSVAFLCEPRVNVFVSVCLLSMVTVILHVLNVSENFTILDLTPHYHIIQQFCNISHFSPYCAALVFIWVDNLSEWICCGCRWCEWVRCVCKRLHHLFTYSPSLFHSVCDNCFFVAVIQHSYIEALQMFLWNAIPIIPLSSMVL